MLEQMLAEIREAIFTGDFETAKQMATEACIYAHEQNINRDELYELAIVAHAREAREFALRKAPSADLTDSYFATATQIINDIETAARAIGLPEYRIFELIHGDAN